VTLGYALSSEEHRPNDLVGNAWRAEEIGFKFALISDHFHPWIDAQGHSPFVWSVLGGIAQVTQELQIGTGVTCPLIRTHPAIIAQAAATVSAMMRGRFFLGVGTGENLNEHVTGARWPPIDTRLEMLEEAIGLMRSLWTGEEVNYRGMYYTVENARLYTKPSGQIPIMIAAGGQKSALLAGVLGDGLISTSPESEVVQTFEEAAGKERPKYAQVTVCWDRDEQAALETAYTTWPTAAVAGQLSQELALPAHFEQAAKMVDKEDIKKIIACGPDTERIVGQIDTFADAGFDHVYLHQIGPKQEEFFEVCERELLPHYKQRKAA
jgi:G6PDH family F420-dependent oxidoreductase